MLENTENVIFMHSITLTYMVQQQYMRQNLKSNHNPAAYSKHQWYPFILFVREEWLFVAASLFLSNIYTKNDISFGKITSFYHIFFYWRRRWTKHTKKTDKTKRYINVYWKTYRFLCKIHMNDGSHRHITM